MLLLSPVCYRECSGVCCTVIEKRARSLSASLWSANKVTSFISSIHPSKQNQRTTYQKSKPPFKQKLTTLPDSPPPPKHPTPPPQPQRNLLPRQLDRLLLQTRLRRPAAAPPLPGPVLAVGRAAAAPAEPALLQARQHRGHARLLGL